MISGFYPALIAAPASVPRRVILLMLAFIGITVLTGLGVLTGIDSK